MYLLILLVAVAGVWGGIAYSSFHSAVKERNRLVDTRTRDALAPADGPMLTSPQNILLLGTDSRGGSERGRSDSLILARIDIPRRRIALLSVPRDLRVPVPELGQEKINSAYYSGGPARAIRTVSRYTGVDIHHVAMIDFAGFRTLIDRIDGIDVNNPRPIISERFDGRVWKFWKGDLHLNGRRALAYARVRKNRRDPSESDLTRGQRQQAVIDAVARKVASPRTLLNPSEVPTAVVQPLTTDLAASEFVALLIARSWARPENVLHCRLGGEIAYIGGESVIQGDETNRATVHMWLGDQPPLKPNLLANQFAPGCTRDRP